MLCVGCLSVDSLRVCAFDSENNFYPYDVPGVAVAMFDSNLQSLYNSVVTLNTSNNKYYVANSSYSNVYHITVNNSGDEMYFTFPYNPDLYDYYLLGTVVGKTTTSTGFTYKPTNIFATGYNVDTEKYFNYPYYDLNIYNIDNAMYKGFGFSQRVAFEEVGNVGIHNIQLAQDKDNTGSVPANIIMEFGVLAVDKTLSEELTLAAILDKLDSMENSLMNSINSAADEVVEGIENQYSVSDEENFDVEDIVDQVNEKAGVLSFGTDTLVNFLDLFDAANATNTQITFPGFSMEVQGETYQVWPDYHYDLSELETQFGALIEVVRWGCVMAVWLAILNYLVKAYDSIFGR